MTDPTRPDPGKKPDLRWLKVDRLFVDHRYQRTLESTRSQKLVAAIAANFRWLAFQAIQATADPRTGGWLVIDGQHRVEAARLAGIAEVPAVVVDAVSLADQATAFVRANTDRVQVNLFALHRASVLAKDPRALAIDRTCKAAGIEIPAYPIPADKLKPGQTLALATIAHLPGRYGEAVAVEALTAVARAYAQRSGALRAAVIQAAAIVCKEAAEDARAGVPGLIQGYLQRIDPIKLQTQAFSMRARSGGTEAQALAQIIRKAIDNPSRLPVAASDDGFMQPLTKAQLMGRR